MRYAQGGPLDPWPRSGTVLLICSKDLGQLLICSKDLGQLLICSKDLGQHSWVMGFAHGPFGAMVASLPICLRRIRDTAQGCWHRSIYLWDLFFVEGVMILSIEVGVLLSWLYKLKMVGKLLLALSLNTSDLIKNSLKANQATPFLSPTTLLHKEFLIEAQGRYL